MAATPQYPQIEILPTDETEPAETEIVQLPPRKVAEPNEWRRQTRATAKALGVTRRRVLKAVKRFSRDERRKSE